MSGITNGLPVVGSAAGSAAIVQPAAASNPTEAVLAFTGVALGLYLGLALLFVASGLLLRFVGRRLSRRHGEG